MARTFRLARADDRAGIIAFVNAHWDSRHPLVNVPAFFDYYYRAEDGALRFALAEDDGALAAAAGYIPASAAARPDVWVSIWVADKAARGAGLELMAELPALLGCRTLACNNIRENTLPFYAFLGYSTGRLSQYYRLAPRAAYTLARVAHPAIPPVSGDATLSEIVTPAQLHEASGAVFTGARLATMNPQKDEWYLRRRYFDFPPAAPSHRYRLFSAAAGGAPFALLAVRLATWKGASALRIVDYIGLPDEFARLGAEIDGLLQDSGAEYADCYCAGIPEDSMCAAGFTLRPPGSADIIPNYLNPPLFENTDFFYFTTCPEHFTIFKADGDQDRPNIRL